MTRWMLSMFSILLIACKLSVTTPVTTSGYIAIADSKIYYETTGEGPAVIFLHGGFLDHRMWKKQVAALAGNFRVITLDMRGHGLTVDGDSSYFMYEGVHVLMDSLKLKKATIVGLSLGAVAAVDFALQYPQYTDKLILAGPGINRLTTAFAEDSNMFQNARYMEDAIVNKKDTALGAEYFVRSWYDGPDRKPAETDTIERAEVFNMALANMRSHRLQYWTRFAEPPAIAFLKNIKAPTLIICGEQDQYRIFKNKDTLTAAIPHTQTVMIPGTAHMSNMEKPLEFDKALKDFLMKE
jgi:3-oxoadipate enol-lactonase